MQLIPNDDQDNDCYDMLPRSGAFEVSTVLEQEKQGSVEIVLFSKIVASMWPHCGGLAKKLGQYWAAK